MRQNYVRITVSYILLLILSLCFIHNPVKVFSQVTTSGFPKTEIKMHQGAPAIFINGKPNAGFTYMTYNIIPEIYRDFGRIGVDLASFSTTCDFGFYFPDQPVAFLGPGKYNFSDVDKRFEKIVQANPDVLLFPRIYVCSPPWWDEKYPEDLARYHDGSSEKVVIQQGRKNKIPSWASRQWRDDTAENLRQFVRHVRSKPYGKNVIGYHIASGHTEEWFYWTSYTEDFLDYSKPQTDAFKNWLKSKYQTENNLQEAWHNPNITFDAVQVPSKTERLRHDFFLFRDPVKSQQVIDYYIFHSEIVPETIAYLAKAVKEACNRESLVGAFYGYFFELSGSSYASQNGGHLALGKLLECPDLDFLTSPTSYAFRDVGTGASVYMSVIGSIKLHGKLWMDENDYRTHLLSPDARLGRGNNLKEDEQNQKRQLGHEIENASGAWWFDMGGKWYDEPEFMDIIKNLNDIGERSINVDRQSAAEIAVVVDEQSVCALSLDNAFTGPGLAQQRKPIAMMGAPVDYIFLNDLRKAKPYKLYIFLNAFSLNKDQVGMIRELPQRGAQSILWIYAPGFSGKSLDINRCFDLTGIKLGMIEKSCPLEIEITPAGAAQLSGISEKSTFGTKNEIGPVFYGDDPSAAILGALKVNGKPGLITKTVNGIQVYYSAAPLLSAEVLRAIAKKSGVHIYNNRDEVLYVNNSFLTLHTNEASTRTIALPKATDIYDVYEGKTIATNAREITLQLPAKHTIIYFLGSEQEWKNRK
ncbi:MAG: beta-galactosidase [Patescibacteria group bacterium]|nr:beta-galactosidase [Patescibacteria group bacterium]